jgi:stage V sporulation protein G
MNPFGFRLEAKRAPKPEAVRTSRVNRPQLISTEEESTVEITEVRVTLRDEPKLKAFVNVTFDNSFVIRGLKVINGTKGYFVSMPSRKRNNGTHQDIAHPINNEMRRLIEDKVLAAYEEELRKKESGATEEPGGTTDEPVE